MDGGLKLEGATKENSFKSLLYTAKCHENVITVLRGSVAPLKASLVPHAHVFSKAYPVLPVDCPEHLVLLFEFHL
jgi:hypothetical protein